MNEWIQALPLAWMALGIFGVTYLVAAGIFLVVMALAVGERARNFKAVSPGMLPPEVGAHRLRTLRRLHYPQARQKERAAGGSLSAARMFVW